MIIILYSWMKLEKKISADKKGHIGFSSISINNMTDRRWAEPPSGYTTTDPMKLLSTDRILIWVYLIEPDRFIS